MKRKDKYQYDVGAELVRLECLVPKSVAREIEEAADRANRAANRFAGEVVASAWRSKATQTNTDK